MDKTSATHTCTVQRRNGAFCDAPAADDMPFPICARHAIKLYMRMMEHARSKAGWAMTPEQKAHERAAAAERDRVRAALAAEQSVVYYLALPGGEVKIGYTTNLTDRLSALRLRRDAVLATEPGHQPLEAIRHKQFAAIRDGRLENFEHTPELAAHIAAIRAQHGDPVITTYPKVG